VTKRIVWLVASVTMLAIVALFVPTSIAIQSRNLHSSRLELQREASMAAISISPDETLQVDSTATISNGKHHQLAIYGPDNKLVDGDGPPIGDKAVLDALRGEFGQQSTRGDQIAAVPIPRTGGAVAALRIAERYDDPASKSQQQLVLLALFALMVVMFAALLGWSLARKLTRPLLELRQAANAIGRGALDTAVPTTSLVELADLGRTLASTAERVQQTVERERAFSSQVSHQLRTPLAAMRVAIETEMADPRTNHELVLNDALSAITRLEQTTNGLLALSRGTVSDRTTVRLDVIASDARHRWSRTFLAAHRSLELVSEPAVGFGSETAVNQILDVLLENSLAHGRGTTRISVGACDGDEAQITVHDDGEIDEFTDPFAAARATGHGIGLKLARSLAETERCALRVSNHRPVTFELRLPSADPTISADGPDSDPELTAAVLGEDGVRSL
jgi:signal transduction histidine kinase